MKRILLSMLTVTTVTLSVDKPEIEWVDLANDVHSGDSTSSSPLDPCHYPEPSPTSLHARHAVAPSPDNRLAALTATALAAATSVYTNKQRGLVTANSDKKEETTSSSSNGLRVIRPKPSPDFPTPPTPEKRTLAASPSPSEASSSSNPSETTPLLKNQHRDYASLPRLPKPPRDRSCCGTFAAFCSSIFFGSEA